MAVLEADRIAAEREEKRLAEELLDTKARALMREASAVDVRAALERYEAAQAAAAGVRDSQEVKRRALELAEKGLSTREQEAIAAVLARLRPDYAKHLRAAVAAAEQLMEAREAMHEIRADLYANRAGEEWRRWPLAPTHSLEPWLRHVRERGMLD
jgi:hypothetical protein